MVTNDSKLAIAVAAATFAISACATTGDGIEPGNYQCQELKALAAEQQEITLRGFIGTSSVYTSADSCDSILYTAVPTAWKTSDVLSCVVGYRCEEIISKEGGDGGQ